MISPTELQRFTPVQIIVINDAAAMAEELVSNAYKMSASQWLRRKYDFKTAADLDPGEIVHGPLAQIVRYEGQRMDSSLGSAVYDFYKICLQDHAILEAMRHDIEIKLFPFSLYILAHELIHVVRFSKFLCNFAATDNERMAEESIVHQKTHDMLSHLTLDGLPEVFRFYNKWRLPMEKVSDS